MAPKTRQSRRNSMVELEAGADDEDNDSSSEDGDLSLTELLQRQINEKAEADKDSNFFVDDDENESGTTTDDCSGDDEAPAGAPAAEEPANKETQKAAKSVAKRENMALARRVGETNKGEPPEFDPVRFGMYYSKINADLEISLWRMANEYMHKESYSFSVGYERGLTEENLHGQYQGSIRMPNTTKGCDAVKAHFKKYMDIGTHSGYKVQVKLMESTQSDEKMNNYVQKDRPKPWYIYDSKDVNGDPYTEEYNDFCRDKYKEGAVHMRTVINSLFAQAECRNYAFKKIVLTRANMMKYAEAYMQKQREEFQEKYYDELPSLCHHLQEMIVSERYVFSADFLARGYRFDRMSAEKMWRMTCLPEQTTFQDVANAVFTGNPECFNTAEAHGIWVSQPVEEVQSFPHTIDISREEYQTTHKRKKDIRSPPKSTKPDAQTEPLNLVQIQKRLESLRFERSEREAAKSSDDESDGSLSL